MNKKYARFTGIALAAATFVAGIATVSTAATQTNGSDEALYIYNGQTGSLIDAATTMEWNANLLSSGSETSLMGVNSCPSTSTGAYAFVSPRSSERTLGSWGAYKSFSLPGSKNLSRIQLRPADLNLGDTGQGTIKTNGGQYSLGLACSSQSGVVIDKVMYRHIQVTAGTGVFTAVATSDNAGTPPTEPEPNPVATSGTVALSATTIASVEGTLSLAVDANASTTFGTATLSGDNKSTSTGALPNVTVTDGRFNSMPGWDLKATVLDFVKTGSPGVTIGKENLGISPTVVAGSTTAAGVTPGTARTAGTAFSSPFTVATAAAAQSVGDSVIGGTLTFVAPVGKPAGTYTSTLTLTLASK
jgi:hypothetical protein